MKRTLPIILAALFILSACNSTETRTVRMIVGTLTEGNGSCGLYMYSFNQDDASWTLLDTAAVGNPTYILPFPEEKRAYAVVEYNDGRQGVASLILNDSSIDLQSMQSTDGEFSGADPCNILYHGSYVLTTNYSGGSVSFFPVNADGSIEPIASQFRPQDPEPEKPHMHCAMLTPDGKYIFVNDLGSDCIWRFNAENPGEPETAFAFDRSSHPGPRHLIFNAAGDRAYVLGELGDVLSVFAYADGELTHLQTVEAYDGNGKGSADLHLTPDGRFLYTSHRLKEDGISIFKVKDDGTVERTGYQHTGIHPRNFTISPDGRYLLVALRDSNRVEVYEINAEDGSLSDTGKTLELPSPMFVRIF